MAFQKISVLQVAPLVLLLCNQVVCLLPPTISSNSSTNALVFKADFSKPTISQAFGGARIGYGERNVVLWASGGGIEVHYPAGSYSPEGPIVGGFGVWTDHPVPGEAASFKYSVFFPAGFNFVKGGKLPGLYGGKKQCAGGDPAVDCFSTRYVSCIKKFTFFKYFYYKNSKQNKTKH